MMQEKRLILHLELGQIEGGFVQGQGWLTMEEVNWKPNGKITDYFTFYL